MMQPVHRAGDRGRALPGQTLVLFALASLILLGGMGLAMDVGYDLFQRRTMQNAADTAALAGTMAVLSYQAQGVSVSTNQVACTAAKNNGLPSATSCTAPGGPNTSSFTCVFVDNTTSPVQVSGTEVPCTAAMPATATGVRVTVREVHSTFVMRALGIDKSQSGATATSNITVLQAPPQMDLSRAPFIVCAIAAGTNNVDVPLVTPTSPNVNGDPVATLPVTLNLANSGPAHPIRVYWPNGGNSEKGTTKCGLGSQNKGYTDGPTPNPFDPNTGGNVYGSQGMRVGQVYANLDACMQNSTLFNSVGCLAPLPIYDAGTPPAPCAQSYCVRMVAWGWFRLFPNQGQGNPHAIQGYLEGNVPGSGPGTVTYVPGTKYVGLAVKLTK